MVAATVGLHNQLGQVRPVIISTGGLSGVSDRLDQDDFSPSTAEDNSHSVRVPESSAVGHCLSQTVGQADRETDSLGVGHTTSPAALSPVTNVAVQSSALWASELRDNSAIDSELQRGAPLVVACLEACNGCNIITPTANLVITTDSSSLGWGAECQGLTTQGRWSQTESRQHVNVLELQALDFAVQAFARNRTYSHIHIQTDNTTAMAHRVDNSRTGAIGGYSRRSSSRSPGL